MQAQAKWKKPFSAKRQQFVGRLSQITEPFSG